MDTSLIEQDLKNHLNLCLPDHPFKDVIHYAVFPPGKLFRPCLVWSLAKDLSGITENHKFFASSLEMHHAYTLIHDDLPAMDNDDFRRGKPSTHKAFNENKAILAGDALLNSSFGILSHIESKYLPDLIHTYSELTGAKGLILGQVMDLDTNDNSIDDIILIHTLKTSRLIQLALVGTNLLSNSPLERNTLMQLGEDLGISFQLLDDIIEFSNELSEHEKKINPFMKYQQTDLINLLINKLQTIKSLTQKNRLNFLESYISKYFTQIHLKITQNISAISKSIANVQKIMVELE